MVRSAAATLLAALVTGCLYNFHGGGLPGNVKTVAVIPFDNRTGEPLLTGEVSDAIRQAVEGRLGLRAAAEADADAVVRGEIVRYDPDVPLSFSSSSGVVDVTRRQVTIVVNIEIVDQREGKALWRGSGISVSGEYQPPQEAAGRAVAIQKLVTTFVEGAQSQW
ncbi:MAG: LPS assembly lipoprotein LptE [Gemmatimonadales bacterium]